jgi:hypothetical protein
MTTRVPKATGTGMGNETVVNLDGSPHNPGQQGRDVADSNGDTAASTNTIFDYSKKYPSTDATQKRNAIFSNYSQVRHSTGTPQPNSSDRAMAFSILIAFIGVGVSTAFLASASEGQKVIKHYSSKVMPARLSNPWRANGMILR